MTETSTPRSELIMSGLLAFICIAFTVKYIHTEHVLEESENNRELNATVHVNEPYAHTYKLSLNPQAKSGKSLLHVSLLASCLYTSATLVVHFVCLQSDTGREPKHLVELEFHYLPACTHFPACGKVAWRQ